MFTLAQGMAFDGWRTGGRHEPEHDVKLWCKCDDLVLCHEHADGDGYIDPATKRVMQIWVCEVCGKEHDKPEVQQ